MTTNTNDLLPVGLSDRLPREAAALTHAMRGALSVMDSHGYDRVRPPLIEFETSMAERMAKSGDGVQPRRMFRFVDPVSLRTMALRSDMTVQIGRIAATSMAAAPRPLRLCYAGEVATITSDQLDPARQRLQLGAELIGSDSVAAAGEVVALAIESLEAAGATGISVDFTLPDLVDTLAEKALPLSVDQIASVRRELDTKDAGGLKQAGGEAYLPLLYATGPFEVAIERLAAIDAGGALASRIEGLRTIAARVCDKARVTLDPTERHGFEYQSWFGFTIYAEGVRGAMGRGGTYSISGATSAQDGAATGFSLYIDRLLDTLDKNSTRKAVFLALEHDAKVAAQLRSDGWRTIAALSENDDPEQLECTHILSANTPEKLPG
ncbi:ATP phosphoribosyltransferase regulatory subunit [Pontixanthobacter aquaemixtae]|uniref:ATP phosphoribosyltransferase regulatory subunit n=1 Tax=Pontixanthobacter aquaemixtae TaxID=1958940 RepID=A0A844ZQG8_9SPHN|nr:ATP phosphoribosyltransferase regulatory subunit [Pontixanthobacter aquaemixtae]MXO89582.1 ATP phosphoribosyltransferase regulatory subunit [Pontixanthobacter aquaemixtae]